MENFKAYFDEQFISSAVTGSIYDPLTVMLNAAHNERIQLLDKLPIGDIKNKTVVDFGTGSWGFACVYTRLHQCKLAIGIDISPEAVAMSETLSSTGNFAYGNRFKYLVSDGLTLPLTDQSVDIFFTGECIEHVENTDVFLDEIHRVLKPGGTLILTTPNPNPWFYRAFGIEYAVGPEHIALMGYNELGSYLAPRFETTVWQGYNLSVHPEIDQKITDPEFARHWAGALTENPQDASGFIVMAKARSNYLPSTYTRSTFRLNSDSVRCSGIWKELPIHAGLSAHMIKAGGEIRIQFSGEQLIVLLWMHDWSGIAEVSVGEKCQEIDLYSRFGGFKRLVFRDLDVSVAQTLSIKSTGKKNANSNDDQVLFFSASSYEVTSSQKTTIAVNSRK
jgi:SAM-dependent methyltransferase